MKHDWLKQIIDSPAIAAVCEAMSPGTRVGATGMWGSAGYLTAGALHVKTGRPVLIVVAHLDDADEAVDDLSLFDGVEPMSLPAMEVLPGESNVSLELLSERLTLAARLLAGDQPRVLVASVQALMQAVPSRDAMGNVSLELSVKQPYAMDQLVAWLTQAGYRRSDAIEEVGDYSVRGGIVDVYPPGDVPPVRLDFFGDEIDDIAEIDPQSMASDRRRKSVRFIGASTQSMQDDDRTTSIGSMLAEDTIVVMHETMEIEEQSRGYYERLTNPAGIFAPRIVQQELGRFAIVEANQYPSPGMTERAIAMPVGTMMNFVTDAAKAVCELAELTLGTGGGWPHRTIVLCQRQAEADRLAELLAEHAPDARQVIEIEIGYLYRGFLWGDESDKPLALIGHHELFHRYQTRRKIRRIKAGRNVESFLDIDAGDYVVHADHGVAIFHGLRMMRRGEGEGEEYLTLEFAGGAKLHVPASDIERVHKYVGGFAGRPPLSKLGGTRWKKQKAEAQEAARELAKELLQVQAARAAMPGIAYPADTPWMTQFEAEFPYQETDDQLAAMAEIKKDMGGSQPMDRLICGDVGYGKTELAIRAAFKAVQHGKQVAVLCPTTVLCAQHERTFRERMADYPLRIAALNRMKDATSVRQTLEGVAEGSIDIVIGTHRLLSDDVKFTDLGIVVVDEEQKFGVEHKHKLMRFRVTVDVLTLSATPIPRTLHMALLGLRDISSLSTPPADRRAVVTEVVPYDKQRIRQAIIRELNRGGQCFYVHNRVHSIQGVAQEIQRLVPEARIVVGHGRMTGRELEEVMLRFLNHEADVLVSTTIIESGIDIPTANTMFIADCDRFGLAELHQLRGRVGRYKHRAYCYMMLPEARALSEVAMRRLRAIEEYSMLGAGFKIAMRDMEIRGVGNLLGSQQSGHIAAVGYEMYCEMLEHTTREMRHDEPPAATDAHLEIAITGHLPRKYIPSDRHRMEVYRRLTRAGGVEAIREIERNLMDAYGPLPKPAQMLLQLSEIRTALASAGVVSLTRDGKDLIFMTHDVKRLSPLLEGAPGSVRLVDAPSKDMPGTVYFRPPENYLSEAETLLAVLRKILVRGKK